MLTGTDDLIQGYWLGMLIGTDDLSYVYWVCLWALMIFFMGIGYAHGY